MVCLCSLVIKRTLGKGESEGLIPSIGLMTDQQNNTQDRDNDQEETDKERFERLSKKTFEENADKYAIMGNAE